MSVIFGIREKDKIIVAGDNRGTTKNGDFISDDFEKVTVINEKLCFATAGSEAIAFAISNEINKIGNLKTMLVDELINVIKNFYNELVEKECYSILSMPFYCIIAGQNNNFEDCLIAGQNHKNLFNVQNIQMLLFNPPDLNLTDCDIIFAKNLKNSHSNFVEKTIKEISDKSNLVSPTGSKWIYDIRTHKGILYSF